MYLGWDDVSFGHRCIGMTHTSAYLDQRDSENAQIRGE